MDMRRSDWLWLGAILGVALGLRAIGLNASLWYDEVVTLVGFTRLPAIDIVTTYTTLNNHVFFSLQAHGAIALFGESAWALRLPAVLFGAAGVGALWWLARLTVPVWEARFAALLLAFSYHHIWFSQNARGYTGLIFWCLIASVLFLRGIERPGWGTWIGYGVAVAAAGYTHLTAGFVVAAHGLVWLGLLAWRALGRDAQNRYAGLADAKPFWGFVLGGVAVALLYAPMIPQMIDTVGAVSQSSTEAVTVAEWRNPLWTLLEIFRSVQGLGALAVIGLPVVLVVAAIGLVDLTRRHPAMVAIFLIHVPLTLGIALALSFRIWPRYFLFDLGFVLLCLAAGVFILAGWMARLAESRLGWRVSGRTLGILAATIAVLCSATLLPKNYRTPKQDFLGARDFIEASRQPGDAAASLGLATLPFKAYYAPHWDIVKTQADLDRLRARAKRVWLVYGFSAHTRVHFPKILAVLKSDFELVRTLPGTLGDGWLAIYRSRPKGG